MTAEDAIPRPADGTGKIAPADRARYAAAAAADHDPELCFGPAAAAFRDIRPLLLAGDRRAPALDPEKVDQITSALDGGASKASVCRSFGVARSTLDDTLKRSGWRGIRTEAE